jgi:hypothetical protein
MADAGAERERRIGKNEALFRDVNERMQGLNETFASFTRKMEIVCECAEMSCVERISIPVDQYETLRADPTMFAVVPGHEVPDVEEVVERRDSYDVIRKFAGVPARIARETDPRT